MSVHQLILQNILPGAPSTTRAVSTSLSAFGNILAYGSGNNVVVRNMEKPSDVIIFGRHTSPITAVRISPFGNLVASGDHNGNLIVWVRQPNPREVLNTRQLQGPVRDIGWTSDEERLVVVGEGKSMFAAAISITANTIGTINGHTQSILSCDMRCERPYRIVTGGADSMVGFYEGVPFEFKFNVKGHSDKVTCVRYSPDMETVATVSRSGDILLLDGKTGMQKATIATGHNGTIYAVAWSPDGTKLVTASADKSVKVFNAASGTLISVCSFGTDVNDMQQGVVYTPQGIFSVSLGGDLTLIGEEGSPKSFFGGHQGRVLLINGDSSGRIVSVSVERVLVWQEVDGSTRKTRKIPITSNIILAAAFNKDNLYLVVNNDLLCCALSDMHPTIISKEVVNVTALAITANGTAVVLSKNGFVVIDATGQKTAEEKLDRFDGTSATACGDKVMLGGDKLVKGYHITTGFSPNMFVQFSGHHTGIVACVSFSHDGQRVASGDANRNIFVWSVIDGSVLCRDLVFHTLRVTCLTFSPNNSSLLFSGSMDASLIVWDLNAQKRMTEDAAHRGGVSAVTWTQEGTLISGGSDCCIRQWRLPST